MRIKQIISSDNKSSLFSGLKNLVSNPHQFEMNIRDEANIVQLRVAKNQVGGSTMKVRASNMSNNFEENKAEKKNSDPSDLKVKQPLYI